MGNGWTGGRWSDLEGGAWLRDKDGNVGLGAG